MIYSGGAKMSKSKGNVVAPGRDRGRATAPTRCGCTRCSWARPTPTRSGPTPASPGPARFVRSAYRVVSEIAERTHGRPAAGLRRRRPGRRTWPGRQHRTDRARQRRHRPAPALQHRDRRLHGAAERDLARRASRCTAIRPASACCAPPPARWCRCCSRSRRTWPRSCGSGWAASGCGRSRGPSPTSAFLAADTYECVVQVNGKVRDRVQLPRGLDRDAMLAAARDAAERARAHRRQGGRQGDRRARQARQHRRTLNN